MANAGGDCRALERARERGLGDPKLREQISALDYDTRGGTAGEFAVTVGIAKARRRGLALVAWPRQLPPDNRGRPQGSGPSSSATRALELDVRADLEDAVGWDVVVARDRGGVAVATRPGWRH